MKRALARLAMLPFETGIGGLLLTSGIVELCGWGKPDKILAVLPQWEVAGLSILALISGIFMLVGVGKPSKRFELSGLFFMMAVIGVRLFLFAYLIGLNEEFIVTGVFDASLLWSAVARIITLARGKSLMWVRGDDELRS